MELSQPERGGAPEIAGRYQVGNQLAVGGMGTIFTAFDTLAQRQIAYKRLRVTNESARPRLTALFEREYNALGRLKHPNIVEVHDYGLDGEGPFYTMELLTGRDLAQAAPLSLVEACRVLRDVASALALLHARRLVHRDVTPANVRLTHDGRAKLLDFGALSEFGVAAEIVGTPAFIAPECLAGDALDARTDLFALGALAYWALTKRHAYPARNVSELMAAWDVSVGPPSHYVAEIPRELDELLLSLLERDRVARPASAAHVIERLTAIAGLTPERDEQKVAYSYLMHPPLVGRDQALAQLKRAIAETADGKGRALMIEAAPGLGRSALLDQVAVGAQLAGGNVLRFQPSGKREAGLAQSIAHWMRAVFPDLYQSKAVGLAALSRATRAPTRGANAAGELSERRAKLIDVIRECVLEMSERAPLTLLVDDVQRADAESLALLATLAPLSKRARLLLVTSLNDAAQVGAVRALSELSRASLRITLKALDEADVSALVETVFGGAPNAQRLAPVLHAQSGGNPGQCMDLCRLLLQQGEIRYALGTFVLPFAPRCDARQTHALELTRLADLSEQALEVVRLLSAHDSALSGTQVASALSYAPEQLVTACEALAARGLIRRSDGDLSLTSESLRGAVYGALPAQVSKRLHAALSRCIVEHGAGSIESKLSACHHLLRAGQEDEAIELVWAPLQSTLIPLGSVGVCAPVLEELLATMRRRGCSDEQLWSLLWPLVVAGYWGELGALNRHREAALKALANVSGMGLAKRLMPLVGDKLALGLGLAYGMLRFRATPKRFRPRAYSDTMQRFMSAVTMSTATASSAYEPETAWRIVAMLDPLSAMKEESPGWTAREFAIATAELAAGHNLRAAERYGRLIALFDRKKVFDSISQEGFYDGCVHGAAQGRAMAGAKDTLEMAERLASRHPFFKPHVETVKMTYHGLRGEKLQADKHRKHGETLALQGGMSWSAFTVIAQRSAYIAMLSGDTLGVLQASSELERLASIAPNALLFRDLCSAYVALVRGELAAAIGIYERIGASPHARLMRAWELDRSFYAEALMRSGRHEQAKQVCQEVLRLRAEEGASAYVLRLPQQQLALAEARLGNFGAAKQLLAQLAPVVLASEAPLSIGTLARDRARVSLLQGEAAEFEQHFAAMVAAFRVTQNPALILQCRRLLAEAVSAGVVSAPSWEKHELMAPANTQDLASHPPEITELVETGA